MLNRTKLHNATRRGQKVDVSKFIEKWEFELTDIRRRAYTLCGTKKRDSSFVPSAIVFDEHLSQAADRCVRFS